MARFVESDTKRPNLEFVFRSPKQRELAQFGIRQSVNSVCCRPPQPSHFVPCEGPPDGGPFLFYRESSERRSGLTLFSLSAARSGPEVVGSNPTSATSFFSFNSFDKRCNDPNLYRRNTREGRV